jgi:hypothetical protein
MIYTTASDTYAVTTLTSFARTLLDDGNQGSARTTLGVTPGTDVFTQRTLTAPAAGFTITNGDGVSGNPTFTLANDLAALEGMASTGLVARTASETYAQRTITGTANKITVTDGDGIAGNPTLTIPDAVTLVNLTASTSLILPQSAAPAPTAEGSIAWDTDGNFFAVGDGTNTVYPGKTITSQAFTANGTWTKPAGCRAIIVEAVGGGGGGGGINGGGAGTAGGGGGGGSGMYGRTVVIDVTSVSSAAVTIGALGAGGAAGANNGSNGGLTSIVVGATTYAWAGGAGGSGRNATSGSFTFTSPGGQVGGQAQNVQGGTGFGEMGFGNGSGGEAWGGTGGTSYFGAGSGGVYRNSAGATDGLDVANANGGAGGGGGVSVGSATDAAGGDGAAGYMIVYEFY